MASQTKVVAGNVTTYTITDEGNNTVAVACTQAPGQIITVKFTSSTNGLLPDGVNMLAQLLLLVGTNLLP